ncbi:putative bifunctional diguanylate cyclase/phosphodiesterase [Steroidobacter sp.]|uniref:putative bifunctional diguanylate cyclase/phosphodiesterase n=1 Tax=Steroidobacter sp. TaxID=1978227 RepID=UPI001A4B010D|nr:EAL domain-containing protein [Steroidobacter sp.]MBL8270488.1 EAL domain-containing protein [Steroidobacter sp.]
MFRRLRTRIIVFFVALIGLVQIAAFLLVHSANSTNARHKIESELELGERIFARLLEQNRDRLSQTARVMAADFALREAIASNDSATAISALRNHAGRINANMTMLVSLDRNVIADTFAVDTQPRQFEFPFLIDRAAKQGSASSIEIVDGHAYQLVVVPVMAPLPISWIVLGFIVDDEVANELRQLTGLEVSFLEVTSGNNHWRVLASTLDAQRAALTAGLPTLPQAANVHLIGEGEEQQQVRVIALDHLGNPQLVAVLQRSVAEAVAAFEQLGNTLLALGAATLLLSIIGSMLIASSITRPLSKLSKAALKIQRGHYDEAVATTSKDEIGVLATSLNHMREGIAEREDQILRLAYRDSLTELPNRALFNKLLAQAVQDATSGGRLVTVLVMNLDRFRIVNESLGYSVGDHLLREVGLRLQGLARTGDVAARLAGDEFALMIENMTPDEAIRTVQKILRAFERPIAYEDQPLDVSASIGVAHFPQHGGNADALLRNADIAMYVAKRNKSGYAIYDPQQTSNHERHLSLLSDIRGAIERDELRVFYQPRISLSSNAAAAVEALLRWQHPTRGMIPPSDFVPFAEQTGYIRLLTRWVLEESIKQFGRWRAKGIELRISVNVSARDLMGRELPDMVDSLLRKYAMPADMLCLEITESGFMEDPAHAQRMLERLHDLGVHLSIDDYGTGYSSLSYVSRLPVKELKIDRSFVKDMLSGETTLTIVRSTIELGHSLGLKVVAEGVEDEASYRHLASLGCDHAQGYYMSKPLPAADLEVWLRDSRWGQVSYEPNKTARVSLLAPRPTR